MKHVRCHLCGGSAYRLIDAHDNDRYWPPDLEVRTVMCTTCSLVFVTPQADAADLRTLYERDYAGTRVGAPAARYLHRKDYDVSRRLAFIDRHLALQRGAVLDIGCASGNLLVRFKERGWEVAGIEPTQSFAEFARSQYDIDVRQGFFQPGSAEASRYDLVVMAEVIEHVADPRETLTEVARVLRPGGYLYIDTPNVRRPNRLDLSRYFRGEHLTVFSPGTMAALLRQIGFEIIAHEWHYYQYVLARNVGAPRATPFPVDPPEEVLADIRRRFRPDLATYYGKKLVKSVVLEALGARWGRRVLERGAALLDRVRRSHVGSKSL